MYLFCVIWKLLFQRLDDVRTSLKIGSSNEVWKVLHDSLRSAAVSSLSFLCKNLGMELILLITFRDTDSCDSLSSNIQP